VPVVDDIAGLRRILARSRVIAVVGLSAQWHRPSYFAAKYMHDHGYRIIPVNPSYTEVLGEKCYPSVAAIPEPVDIVDCLPIGEEPKKLNTACGAEKCPRLPEGRLHERRRNSARLARMRRALAVSIGSL